MRPSNFLFCTVDYLLISSTWVLLLECVRCTTLTQIGTRGRPVVNDSSVVDVKFGLAVLFMDLDGKNNRLSTSAWCRIVSCFSTGYRIVTGVLFEVNTCTRKKTEWNLVSTGLRVLVLYVLCVEFPCSCAVCIVQKFVLFSEMDGWVPCVGPGAVWRDKVTQAGSAYDETVDARHNALKHVSSPGNPFKTNWAQGIVQRCGSYCWPLTTSENYVYPLKCCTSSTNLLSFFFEKFSKLSLLFSPNHCHKNKIQKEQELGHSVHTIRGLQQVPRLGFLFPAVTLRSRRERMWWLQFLVTALFCGYLTEPSSTKFPHKEAHRVCVGEANTVRRNNSSGQGEWGKEKEN